MEVIRNFAEAVGEALASKEEPLSLEEVVSLFLSKADGQLASWLQWISEQPPVLETLALCWKDVLLAIHDTVTTHLVLAKLPDPSEQELSQAISSENLVHDLLEQNRRDGGLLTLYPPSIVRELTNFCSRHAGRNKRTPTSPLESSGILKVPKRQTVMDTYMSTTSASTTNHDVHVAGSETIPSNDVTLEELFAQIPSTPTTSTIGSNIFCRGREKSYTFKSAQFPSGEKYIKLQIYDSPSELMHTPPRDYWKKASFRANVLIGRVSSDPRQTEQILFHLNALKELLVKDMHRYPGVKAVQHDN